MGKYWLVKKAELVAKGAIASGDTEAMKELMDFLDSFVLRQRDKLLSLNKAQGN